MKQSIFAALALASLVATEYVWPSSYDEIEDHLSLQSGYLRRGFIDGVINCGFGTNTPSRQNSAEWIRAAFHDMATHNVATGTGGLDASIFFELDRPENPGSAFNNTFAFFSSFHSIRASASDLLAMSVLVASFSCGGTKMPFRAGRIDAQEAGPAGVPEPQTDLETTQNTFTKAGFNTSDMIAMVACGHTLGGVHSVDFPEIVGVEADPNNDTVAHFDSEFAKFDHGVVTEYLDGTTKNPLVTGGNDTLNSDKRIFSADGNKTMQAMADPAAFQAICADVFTRMIDTVPGSVKLSEPIVGTDIKPYIQGLFLKDDGNISFSGQIRIRTSADTGRDPEDLSVQLTYSDRNGDGSNIIMSRKATFSGGSASGLWGETFHFWEFDSTISPDIGISKFHIHVTKTSTNETITYDNAGIGYPMSDVILYQKSQSCLGNPVGGKMPLTIKALVRKDCVPTTADGLTLDLVREIRRQGVIVPKLEVESVNFQSTGENRGQWSVYTANVDLDTSGWSTTFDIRLHGDNPVEVAFQKTTPLGSNVCS
ncbi:WW domain-containing oxidoreductase [Colletotrichum spaethianum]|uniref:Peroxidase n=1 Tax=Colletotrichum spaethianum TaxID=700344 RepID=A0AA37UKK9_9PEZI|nr:WW domain-containing oxidoreductase [Colletotrichum spaethianum]GKT51464.1 WW domain-containing oxidoreductase [Colletotrichum spaethianum]